MPSRRIEGWTPGDEPMRPLDVKGRPTAPPPKPADMRRTPETPQEWLEACVHEAGHTYTVEGVVVFLNGRNRRLGARAVDLIRDGRGREVHAYLVALNEGMVAT